MSGRYKGVHHKGAPDLEDLRTLAEMVRQLRSITTEDVDSGGHC